MGDGATMKYCSNCKREIAAENFVMHEVHCRRNIILCTHCEEPVARSEMDDHYEEYHASTQCEKCGDSMEKTQLEGHQSECRKRVLACEYCELELAADEMPAHSEYCGTRTEHCAKCSQYIMFKDREKHEQSNCEYPPQPKPNKPNNSTEARRQGGYRGVGGYGGRGFDGRGFGGRGFEGAGFGAGIFGGDDRQSNGFAMDEISRLMRLSAMNSSAAGGSTSSSSSGGNVTRNHFAPRNTRGLKRTNEITRGGAGAGARGRQGRDVNDIRTYDNDELLAQHLAQDLGQEESGVRQWTMEPLIPDDIGDEDTLPCEFCTELVPISMLIQHQSGCQASLSSEAMSSPPSSRRVNERRLNNSERTTARPPPSPPRWLDNLGTSNNDWTADVNSALSTPEDDIMLPCEFCHELYPSMALFTHQSECDLNGTQTPRVQTPAHHPLRAAPAPAPAAWSIPPGSPSPSRRTTQPSFAPSNTSQGRGRGARGGSQGGRGGGSQGVGGGSQSIGGRTSQGSQGAGASGGRATTTTSTAGRTPNSLPSSNNHIRGSRGTKKKNTDPRRDEPGYDQFPTHTDWTGAAGGSGDSLEDGPPTDSRDVSKDDHTSKASSAAHVRATLDSLIQAPDLNSLDKRHKMHQNSNVKAKSGATGIVPGVSGRKYPNRGGERLWTQDDPPPAPYDPSSSLGVQGKRPVGATRGQDQAAAGRNNDFRTRSKKTTNVTRGKGSTRGRRPPQGDV